MLDYEKEEVLSKLYTLRVGMSLLSLEKDKFVQNKKLKEDKERNNISIKQNAVENLQKSRQKLKEKKEEEKAERLFLKKSKKIILSGQINVIKWFLIGIILIVLPIVLIYFYGLSWVVDLGGEDTPERLANLSYANTPVFRELHGVYLFLSNFLLKLEEKFSFLSGLLYLIWLILPLPIIGLFVLGKLSFGFFREWRDSKSEWVARRLNAPVKIKSLHGEVNALEKDCERRQKMCRDLPAKLQAELVPVEEKMLEAALDSSVLYQALEQEFSDFLQVVDWGNVDLLIHYFSTGRADAMKEALQQVDRQRQSDALIQAVNNASQQICRTINSAFMQLQKSMAQNFAMLSQQLDLMHQQTQAQIAALSRKVRDLAGDMETNKALQQKSNVGSLQLAEDIHYLRVSTEIRDIKARNNL